MKPHFTLFSTLVLVISSFNFLVAQNVGIGTAAPNAKLHVNGTFKVVDGTQGAGKVLTSDATGMASWQPPPAPSPTYYPSVTICCQTWMTKNLDVATYRNGDPIPKVTTNSAWEALTTGAYCYYNNDSATYAAIYGKLYNWYAVNDPRGLAPEGWHVATDFEWTTLGSCLGGNTEAGGPLKELGTTHWTTPNIGATNITSFTARPSGYRDNEGGWFLGIGQQCNFWTNSQEPTNSNFAIIRQIQNAADDLSRSERHKGYGCAVRCVKD